MDHPASLRHLAELSPAHLLKGLKETAALSPFSLALFSVEEGLLARVGDDIPLCGLPEVERLCREDCSREVREAFRQALADEEPRIYRCPAGLFSFFVPFRLRPEQRCCLVGGGVRDRALTPETESAPGWPPLQAPARELWGRLPLVVETEVLAAALAARNLLPAPGCDALYLRSYEQTVLLLNSVTELLPVIDAAGSEEDVVNLLGEALTVLFNVSRLAVLFPDAEGRGILCRGLMGLDAREVLDGFNPAFLGDAQGGSPVRRFVHDAEQVARFFPHLQAARMHGFPLLVDGEPRGWLALFDVDLPQRDQLLVELLVDKVAGKIERLKVAAAQDQIEGLATTFLDLVMKLAQVRRREDLYESLLQMCAGLVRATKGSLMLLDETGENLTIAASRGMNPALARSMLVKVGQGIAGRVVQTGHALVVHDIETDRRVKIAHRPRFQTKSLVSLPLRTPERLLGVLNLSDKEDGRPFGERDVKLLNRFIAHACNLIGPVSAVERAGQLEELAVTDPLTGLYNRRFLEQRLGEEISRSSRQNQGLAIMFIDLDHFKEYNDLCGHLAGDLALQKIAQLLRSSAREMDIVTRYGGEEFCLLLPATSGREALMVAERIRRNIERAPFPREETLPLSRLTVSIGVACYPGDGLKGRDLIHAADVALYQAKSAGRNRVQRYQADLSAAAPRSLT